MFSGEGVGEEMLSVAMEVEVNTTPLSSSDPDKEGGCNYYLNQRRSNSAPTPPLPRYRTPFRNAKGFGNWMYEVLDGTTFMKVTLKFVRYCQKYKIHDLVRLSKRYFRDFQRLYFLQGVYMIATTINEKKYINQVLEKEWQVMLERRNERAASISVGSIM